MSRHPTETLDQLRTFACEVGANKSRRLILLLSGPMGAGKTQFTKFLIESLGSTEAVSPSFAIHHSYETSVRDIHHLDLFRLESADDLESTGFWDIFCADDAWVIIEWAEKLDEFGLRNQLPKSWPQIKLVFASAPDRAIEFTQLS